MGKTIVQDQEWGELSRETGYGHITDVKAEPGKRNAHVVINADHLKDPVQGWVDTELDRTMFVAAQEAKKSGQRIWYRIDVHRKHNIDKTIPFADLARDAKVRDVREVTAVDGDGTPLEPGRSTEPSLPLDEPPAPAAPAAPASDRQPEPDRHTDPAPPPADAAAPPADQPPPPAPAARRPRVEEARPWEVLNSDGSLNLGSYAVKASQDMVLHAHELVRTRPSDDPMPPPTETQVGAVAHRLLRCADIAQASVRADGHADRNDNSHARAREAVKAAVAIHPVPFVDWKDGADKWEKDVAEYATMIMTVAVKLVDREVP